MSFSFGYILNVIKSSRCLSLTCCSLVLLASLLSLFNVPKISTGCVCFTRSRAVPFSWSVVDLADVTSPSSWKSSFVPNKLGDLLLAPFVSLDANFCVDTCDGDEVQQPMVMTVLCVSSENLSAL